MKRLSLYISFLVFTVTAFGQGAVNFISPNYRDVVMAGNEIEIVWTGYDVENVKLQYSDDHGKTWNIIAESIPFKNYSYKWTIPDVAGKIINLLITDNQRTHIFDLGDNLNVIYDSALPNKSVTPNQIQSDPNVLEIMPLGDSITEGTAGYTDSYRKDLFDSLTTNGYHFDFVGPFQAGSGTDNDHAGYASRHAHHWRNFTYYSLDDQIPNTEISPGNFVNILTEYPPDIILLHIGTNDIGEFYREDEGTSHLAPPPLSLNQLIDITKNEVDDILDVIDTYSPNSPVFLAQIIKRESVDQTDSYDDTTYPINELNAVIGFNDALPAMVASRTDEIILVNMEGELTLGTSNDYADAVHPNSSGYQKMADKWFDEIQKYFTPALALPDDNATNQSVNVELSWNAPDGAGLGQTTTYELQVDDDINFGSPIPGLTNLTSTSETMNGLSYNTTYYWRVQATNFNGTSYWTQTRSFTTEPAEIVVSAKIFLEGPYNGTNMNTSLASGGYLPTSQPYSGSPWSYAGTESVSSGFFTTNNIVDWVLVEVRDQSTPSSVLGTRAAFVRNDGRLFDTDGSVDVNFTGLPDGNYYIAIKHRNHLAVMSSSPVSLLSSSTTYDFTTAQSQAYGTNPMKDLGGEFGMFAGDADANGGVFIEDYQDYKLNQANIGYMKSDFDLNSGVFIEDYSIYQNNQAKINQVP